MIKKIPLGQASAEDTLFWPHSSNGVYSCKSGYRFLKEEAAAQGEVVQDHQNRDKHIWKSIWSMHTPQKVKTMLWRACREALPTKQALVRRKVIDVSDCERCCNSTENSLHALWQCPELDPVWDNAELWGFRSSVQFLDLKELWSWLIMQKKDVELFAATVWMIWNQRNRVRLNLPAESLHQLAHTARTWLLEFQRRNVVRAPQVQQGTRRARSRWKPPRSEFLKINYDGAIFPNENKSGIGVVIRDGDGEVIASCSKLLHQAYSSREVEAMAAVTALSLASDIGVQQAILEGDSLEVFKAQTDDSVPLAPFGLFIDEVKSLSSQFVKLLYSHTFREGNSLAHGLARHAIGIPDFLVWMEDVPPHLYSVVQADLRGAF